MFQPLLNVSAGGASASLPAGAPASTHALSVAISRSTRRRSLAKCPTTGIGKPWRHLPARDRSLDGARPRPRLLVGEERHRRHFAGPVAALAVGLENRKHVLVEGRRFCRRNGCSQQGTDDGNQARSHTRSLLKVDREMPKKYTANDPSEFSQIPQGGQLSEFTQMLKKLPIRVGEWRRCRESRSRLTPLSPRWPSRVSR